MREFKERNFWYGGVKIFNCTYIRLILKYYFFRLRNEEVIGGFYRILLLSNSWVRMNDKWRNIEN